MSVNVDFIEQFANSVFLQSAFPTYDLYLTLYGDDDTDELAGITRVSIPPADWVVTPSASDVGVTTDIDITFEDTPADLCNGAMIMDALTDGNMIVSADFSAPISTTSGGAMVFLAGDISFTITGII